MVNQLYEARIKILVGVRSAGAVGKAALCQKRCSAGGSSGYPAPVVASLQSHGTRTVTSIVSFSSVSSQGDFSVLQNRITSPLSKQMSLSPYCPPDKVTPPIRLRGLLSSECWGPLGPTLSCLSHPSLPNCSLQSSWTVFRSLVILYPFRSRLGLRMLQVPSVPAPLHQPLSKQSFPRSPG